MRGWVLWGASGEAILGAGDTKTSSSLWGAVNAAGAGDCGYSPSVGCVGSDGASTVEGRADHRLGRTGSLLVGSQVSARPLWIQLVQGKVPEQRFL